MNVISISVDALISDIFSWHWDELPRSILKHLANIVNYNQVPDRVISDNEKVRDVVRWGRIDKMKMIRIFIRCLDNGVEIMDEVKIEQYDYKIKHLIHLLKRKPEYIEQFRVDIDKITTSEAATVLSLGEQYFLDKIDPSRYKFNFKESMNIIQGYKYDREIIKQVNYKSLKGYQIAEILTHTGDNNIDLLDIKNLTNIDWINLLSHRPELLSSCDFGRFFSGDIFYSIQLCCMFEEPDLSYLVLDRNVNDISPFGWEKLLTEKPEIFLAHCNFNKLDDNNWSNILKSQPGLHVYKVN
jgi:hypothetical protein